MKLFALILTSAALAGFSTVYAQESSPAPGLNDAQIAMIAVVADTVDIDAGKLATTNASDKKVKEFGETMVRDHTAVNAKATALAKKLGVTPEESDTSKSLATSFCVSPIWSAIVRSTSTRKPGVFVTCCMRRSAAPGIFRSSAII